MHAPPNNAVSQAPSTVLAFTVWVIVDPDNPKAPTIEQLENRIADGPQWLDGVVKVTTRYDGNAPE